MTMKKKLYIFLGIAILIVALSAIIHAKRPTKQDQIVGVWEYKYPFIKILTDEAIAKTEGEFQKIYDGLYFSRILELREDGSYSLYESEESIQAALDQFVENYKTYLPIQVCEAKGATMEEFTELCAQKGYTVAEFINLYMETSGLEESIRQEIEQAVQSNVFEENGTYRYSENKLYLTPEGNVEIPYNYIIVELNEDELIFTDASDTEKVSFSLAGMPIPFSFQRKNEG